ncbi:malonyl-CoA decarboxylase domain-containing protein [Dietzia sp. SYD-A1]|uniref:malonyl-CoA decarboxylase domain-containing protein n=1 Tax=Dietzia sp. SYD-A1 TaxID=2780141 RepID=UPI001890B8D3|nr:malonyl-CoA decarboxylase family protein [Dietzia sp. SYD-A1]
MTPLTRLMDACTELMSDIGEASMRNVGDGLLRAYRELPADRRVEFFTHLVESYGVDPQRVERAYAAWAATGRDTARAAAAEIELVDAVEPRRQKLFRRINHAPGATHALTELRSDLRALLADHPHLRSLDHDLHHLLGSWFNRGFLRMEEVTWDSPGELLDHLIRYEQVHPMAGLDELRRRLQPADRRMYAFFHPATGIRPLIFVEVALTRGVPADIAPILRPGPALSVTEADTAVLYSISNCLDGLAGVSLGSLLIKHVIDEVGDALPHLSTFVTLSPIPGFRRWLDAQDDPHLRGLRHRLAVLDLTQESGRDDTAEVDELRPHVVAAAARYICLVKDDRGRPHDRVARFHLSNGAEAWRLNWPADCSANGINQSYGAMVNYRYEPAELEPRHERFVRHGTVASSDSVTDLLTTHSGSCRPAPPPIERKSHQ